MTSHLQKTTGYSEIEGEMRVFIFGDVRMYVCMSVASKVVLAISQRWLNQIKPILEMLLMLLSSFCASISGEKRTSLSEVTRVTVEVLNPSFEWVILQFHAWNSVKLFFSIMTIVCLKKIMVYLAFSIKYSLLNIFFLWDMVNNRSSKITNGSIDKKNGSCGTIQKWLN